MGLISKTIPGLYNGVSQQPSVLRLDTQGELQENIFSSLVDGLIQRPPTEFIKLLQSKANTDSFIGFINRDENERYFIIFNNDEEEPVEIYTLEGEKCTIIFEDEDAKSYITTVSPKDSIRSVSIADHTFVLNKNIVAEMDTDIKAPEVPPIGLIFVKKGVALTDYKILINDSLVASFSTTEDGQTYKTGTIADNLYNRLVTGISNNVLAITLKGDRYVGDTTPRISISLQSLDQPDQLVLVCDIPFETYEEEDDDGYWETYTDRSKTLDKLYDVLENSINPDYWAVNRVGNTIYIRKLGASTFNASVSVSSDDAIVSYPRSSVWEVTHPSNSDYIVIKRLDGQDFSLRATDSWGNAALIGIKGEAQKFTDLPAQAPEGIVVEIAGDESNDFDSYYLKYEQGIWKETVKPGSLIALKASTLPHKIARTALNTFTVSSIEWAEKTIGDEHSAPDPSFIGRKLNDIFFYKNRLGVLAGDSVIMSKAGDYFNFYPTTAMDVLDDDPIDVSIAESQVSNLATALPSYNSSLLIDTGTQQFMLASGDQLFTPKTVAFDSITSYMTDTRCQPITAGANAYYIVPNGNHSHLYEYFIQPDTLINDAADITAHVPRYIPDNIIQMVANPINDVIFLLSAKNRKELYVYKYFWSGTEKVQSSWSKWIFDDEILGISTIENNVYLLQRNQDEIFLAKMDLSKANTEGLSFRVHLDKAVKVIGDYDEESNLTTWTLPYEDSNASFVVVDLSTGASIKTLEKTSPNIIQAYGDQSDKTCLIGKPYLAKYRFSEPVIRSESTNVADLSIKLQLRTLALSFTNTSYFRLVVTPSNRPPIVHEFTGVVLGVSKIGEPSLMTGDKSFLIMSNSKGTTIDIESDSYLPFEIQTATFQGLAVKLSRGI